MANESELLTRARECTRGGETPIVAWLDGYAAGHADATKSAVAILGETPFGPCVIDESAGQAEKVARFGGATCCVCQSALDILGETPFGPCVIDESAGQAEKVARFGGATCCVCQDTEGGCEFCPKVSD